MVVKVDDPKILNNIKVLVYTTKNGEMFGQGRNLKYETPTLLIASDEGIDSENRYLLSASIDEKKEYCSHVSYMETKNGEQFDPCRMAEMIIKAHMSTIME